MLRRVLLIGALALALAPVAGASPPPGDDNPWLQRRIAVLAHAGGEDENPQETIYAFARARQAGVPILDLDVQITSDGVPVVMHDNTVDDTTNGTGAISSMTFDQVHALDAAYWFTADCAACEGRPTDEYLYRGIRTGAQSAPTGFSAEDFAPPSLEAVFQRFPDAYFDIEIKDDAGDVPALANAVAELIHTNDLSDKVVVASFGQTGMDAFRSAAPDVATSATLDEVTAFFLSSTVPPDAQILDVPPFYELGGTTITIVSPEFVDRAHDAGLAVWVWMDAKDEQNADFYRSLIDMGVDGLNVSRPGVAMDLVRSLGIAWDQTPASVPSSVPSTTTQVTPTDSVPTSDPAPAATARVARPVYTG